MGYAGGEKSRPARIVSRRSGWLARTGGKSDGDGRAKADSPGDKAFGVRHWCVVYRSLFEPKGLLLRVR